MQVIIGFGARAGLTEIGDHIALGNPMRAFTFVDELEARCGSLDRHPQRFPIVGRFDGRPVHKLSHAGFLILYVLPACTSKCCASSTAPATGSACSTPDR
ncbi:type II toxin-antitoxin system RelE/ParE family toxin [Sphingomonas qilianensis]|uniref:Type II toxin-antitoxin system RelE/ParE family toxin n=1 Tax=Sphingomonas qilianensis TaxID=1736690 RepID=A0ABU9XR56_9SPHN